MRKTVLFLMLACTIPHSAIAGPIVTWDAFGVTTFVSNRFPPPPDPLPPGPPPPPQGPPIGTPWSLSISFDPEAAFHTVLSPAPSSPCSTVDVSGSFTLGDTGYTFGGGSNQGFTNAGLLGPGGLLGSTCIDMAVGKIDFFLFPVPTADDPWTLDWGPRFLVASYYDLVTDGSFPDEPTYLQAGSFLFNNDAYQFGGRFAPQAVGVEQPSPVPEPATFALVGIGMAIAARRRRRQAR